MVLLSVVLDFVQEHRAGRAAERLRRPRRRARRAARRRRRARCPLTDVVPGDVVLLAAGDLVPADARLLEAATSSSTRRCSPASPTRSRSTPGEPTAGDREPARRAANAVLHGHLGRQRHGARPRRRDGRAHRVRRHRRHRSSAQPPPTAFERARALRPADPAAHGASGAVRAAGERLARPPAGSSRSCSRWRWRWA